MPDPQKITELVETTTADAADLLAIVNDPAGGAATKKVTFGTFLKTYNRSATEISLGISNDDLDFKEDHGVVIRYGQNATPGTTNMTIATQRALDVAKGDKIIARAPGQFYAISQIEIPNGVIFAGDGLGELGLPGDDDNVTVFQQIDGTEDDMFIFKTDLVAGFERLQNGGIQDMILMGDATATAGHGISFRKTGTRTDDIIHAILASNYFLKRLILRQFPENGVHVRRGATGNVVFRDIGTFFNGGFGINIDTLSSLNMTLDNCGGDGNTAGASIKVTTTIRDGNITIISPFGEYRTNSIYGVTPGFNAAQPYTVEVGDFGSSANVSGVVNIIGGVSLSSFETDPGVAKEGVDAGVHINCTNNNRMPEVNVIGHQIIDETTPPVTSGNNSLIFDALNSTRVPGTVKTALYSRRNGGKAILTGAGHVVLGDTGEFASIQVGDNGLQIRGPLPAYSWNEIDAPTDEKLWSMVCSGGDLTLRTISDAGVAVIAWTIARAANAVSFFRFEKLIRVEGTAADIRSGNNSPEGSATSAIGSIWSRINGGAGTSHYIKESGAGNTGWVTTRPTTEIVTATNIITAAETGATFYLNSAGGFTSTLPAPAANLRYKFIVSTAPTTAYIITTNAGANLLFGTFLDIVGELVYFSAQDTLNFVAALSVVGDSLEVESDGTNWYCKAFSGADGGITVSVT